MATSSPKGFTYVQNSDPMNGPAQINQAELFAETLVGENVASYANLPTSGNWYNRIIMTRDTKWVWVWTGSWTVLNPTGMVRRWTRVVNTSGNNNLQIAQFSVPAIGVASRVVFGVSGAIGFSKTTGTFGIDCTVTKGTLYKPDDNTNTITVPSAQWAGYSYLAQLDLPANTASTITLSSDTGTRNCYFRVRADADRFIAGEYASS